MKHKITVTQDDIDLGIVCCEKLCPVATAVERHFGCKALVGSNGISVATVPHLIEHPLIVREFIERFDYDVEVMPFEFEIEVHE
jgi:hypothetical protein